MHHGFDKNKRKLSYFQSERWMHKIAKVRKYEHMARGENSGVAKLTERIVILIRSMKSPITKSEAKKIAKKFNVSVGHIYHLRSKDPKVRHWNHI